MSLAIVFPGQGSQATGMLSELAAAYPVVNKIYDNASEVLGFDLWQLTQSGPDEQLNKTENTQPALLAAGFACWTTWLEQDGPAPAYLAGHSLGEYTALVCAGVLEFTDAISLVRDRGIFMQDAVPQGEGAMAAILGLTDDEITDVCLSVDNGGVVSAANFNSPGQVVIAGQKRAVEEAIAAAKTAGAKRAVLLPVSVPSHCALMAGAAEKLRERMASLSFKDACLPIVQNVDAGTKTDAASIKHALIEQLHQPVRWVDSVMAMKAHGVTKIIECGPGKVLAGLMRRIDRDMEAMALYDPDTLNNCLGGMK